MMNFFTRATLDEDLAKIPLLSNAPKRPVDFVCLKTMEGQLSGSEESSKKARRQMTAQSSVVVRLLLAVAVMVVTGLILCSARLPPLTHQVELLSVDAGASSEAHAVVWDDHEWVGIHKLYPHTLYLDNGLGRTPPLGWNSWNQLACGVDEEAVKAAADLIVSLGLKDAGYEYVNVDDCWHGPRLPNGTITSDPVKFPSGIKALADYVHSLGLKFGIYSDAGHRTCAGRPGSWNYEEIDAQTYASWGVDFLKYDNCFAEDLPGPKIRYPIMRDALNATGRPIFFSMCEWGVEHPATWARAVGNSWRTTPDIEPTWQSVLSILYDNNQWASMAGPGGFNDPDMLEVGVKKAGKELTAEEERSHFALWALMKSPMLIGADLRNISEHALSLYLNKEVISITQDPLGVQGRMVYHDAANPIAQVWSVPLEGGKAAAALFNAGEQTHKIRLDFGMLGLPSDTRVKLRDLLNRKDLGTFGNSYAATVKPHDVLLLRVEVDSGSEQLAGSVNE